MSLSEKFDSDKELLHPIFSLSKKFDSDKELLHPIFSLLKKFDSDKELHHPIFSLSKKFDSDKELLYPIFSLSNFFDSDKELSCSLAGSKKKHMGGQQKNFISDIVFFNIRMECEKKFDGIFYSVRYCGSKSHF